MAFSTNIYKSWQKIQKQKFLQLKRQIPFYKELFENGLVLDIGCGSGYFEKEFKGNFIGIDNDTMMLRGQVTIFPRVLGDGDRLPFRDSSFDTIVSMDTMHLLKTGDFLRVLKPGGFVFFSAFFNDENYQEKKEALLKKLGQLKIIADFDLIGQEKEYVVVAKK